MARISKRRAAQKKTEENLQKIPYKAGIYVRLSSDYDAGKKESADVQAAIAEKYVEDWNRKHRDSIMITDYYVDLGKTGRNFNRDAFQRLMEDIRQGKINCVIVKDLSRFGRNYLETGNYIEKIFPFLGVRFIAAADGLDTGEGGSGTQQMETEIKNLVNDMYARDFSVKAKQHWKQRRKAGSYAGGPPPYGYLTGRKGKRRVLQPDERTAELVRYIFQRFIQTESYAAAARDLNRRKVNPPAVYRKTGEVFWSSDSGKGKGPYKGWDKSSVERIVKSRTYTGMQVQGKTPIPEKASISEKTLIPVREQAHEPLISAEVFRQAEQVCRKLSEETASHRHPAKGCPIGENRFDSVLYCGVCGRKMTRSSCVKASRDGHKERKEGYYCLNGGRTGADSCPEPNRISGTELTEIVRMLLRLVVQIGLEETEKYEALVRERLHEAEQQLQAEMAKADRRRAAIEEEERQSYMVYRKGKILPEEYAVCRLQLESRRQAMEKCREKLDIQRKSLRIAADRYLAQVRSSLSLRKGNDLTKDRIEALINRIYVYPGKRIEVQFHCRDEMRAEMGEEKREERMNHG